MARRGGGGGGGGGVVDFLGGIRRCARRRWPGLRVIWVYVVEEGCVVDGGEGDVEMCLMVRGEIVLAGLTLEWATVMSSVCG